MGSRSSYWKALPTMTGMQFLTFYVKNMILHRERGNGYMTIIKHDLLRNQKSRKTGLKVSVDLYAYADELYGELSNLKIIDRLKDTPQLGVIKVPKKLEKSRFDYMLLQLYFHQLIKNKLHSQLQFTYNNKVKKKELLLNAGYKRIKDVPTIGDILQLLTIAYNLGHFYNTFTASRAVVILSNKNPEFKKVFIQSSSNPRFKDIAEKLISEQNYQRLHLLNSLLVLERCDQNKASVILAQEILYAYLSQSELEIDSKLHFVFDVFRSVRNVSYTAYDLQIAPTPLTIDLCNEDAILLLFKELLSPYNDQLPAEQMISSISKMLGDNVYNENSNAICYYRISKKMVNLLEKESNGNSFHNYYEQWLNKDSIFNTSYSQSKDFSSNFILKLTFLHDDNELSKKLLLELDRVNNSRVGYYDRYSGERTILVSIRKRCTNKSYTALKILKIVTSYLRASSITSNSDIKYLLITKFFLYYLFKENPIIIKPTVDLETCVLCTRGKNSRVKEIEALLNQGVGNKDERHEVEFMKDRLNEDKINDTSITIPGSIIVYEKGVIGKKLCEFDGMIIHPMRKQNQVILLESKNTKDKPFLAQNCLSEKLDKLGFTYEKNDIQTINHDCYLEYTCDNKK